MIQFLGLSGLVRSLVSEPELAEVIVQKGKKHGGAVLSTNRGNSLVASYQKTMIRPIVCIEQSIIHQEYASDLMTIIQLRDIQATLGHLTMLGSVGDVTISNIMSTINPNRRSGLASLSGLESFGGTNVVKPQKDGKSDSTDVTIDGKGSQFITEYVPLALGRTVNAVVQKDGEKLNFPLTFRQIPYPVPSKDMERYFMAAKGEDGFFARIDKKEVGLISTPDFLTGQDVLKERFKVRYDDMKSVNNYLTQSIKNERQHLAAAAMSGEASLNNLANTFILTQATARQIELSTGKRFNNFQQRETLWKTIRANTIVICNETHGVFTFYTLGESVGETFTRNDIKTKAAKESSVSTLQDIAALLNGGR